MSDTKRSGAFPLRERAAGVLLHITSLPGDYGIGDIGPAAAGFASLLAEMGVRVWQILPITPTNPACAHSPYSGESAFAGNTLLISPDGLAEDGLVDRGELAKYRLPNDGRADFARASAAKRALLDAAYDAFRGGGAYKTRFKQLSDEFWNFCIDEAWWLEDYALFTALKDLERGKPWTDWNRAHRERDWSILDALKNTAPVKEALDRARFEQFIFFRQLARLREACREAGVSLLGDMPIYVADDSADVWGHQELFALGPDGRPEVVAGVPPDYFSKTGQRWGNPIYRWDVIERQDFGWWRGRVAHALRVCDAVRIDHFRGFVGYWEIPADEKTAIKGRWMPGPGARLFGALGEAPGGGPLPLIAEDLGILTPDVIETMEALGLPGMRVLQFAFGDGMPKNPYAPHNHRRGCVVYTGTHDNNTTAGWWADDAGPEERRTFARYAGRNSLSPQEASSEMTRMAMMSTANLAVIQAQDLLGLGSGARMNTPATVKGNWSWRLRDTDMDGLRARAGAFRELAVMTGRCDEPPKNNESPQKGELPKKEDSHDKEENNG